MRCILMLVQYKICQRRQEEICAAMSVAANSCDLGSTEKEDFYNMPAAHARRFYDEGNSSLLQFPL
jgi:hypothetical protein